MTWRVVVVTMVSALLIYGGVLGFMALSGHRDYLTTIQGGRICVTERDTWGHVVQEVCQ